MNFNVILELGARRGWVCRAEAIEVDGATSRHQNARHMQPPVRRIGGFSLVEVTLALGVAAICLILLLGLLPIGIKTQQSGAQQTIANQIMTVILSDLRADLRLPPGQASKE